MATARRLQIQLLFILLAGVSVAALSVLLISDAIRGAERLVLTDTSGILEAATAELDRQCTERMSVESAWPSLPMAAQDVSLRGVSQAVLRSYPGVEGGYFQADRPLGYSFPTHDNPSAKTDVPAAELDAIRAAVEQSASTRRYAERVRRGAHDVVVVGARASPANQTVSWAMKRLSGLSDPTAQRRRWLLAALVLAALLSLAGTLMTAVALQRGVAAIKTGLRTLERDFQQRLPEQRDELGEISRAINKMADIRLKLEAQLRREDRLRAMGRLVSGIAHEIRNPLNSIRLTAQLLERRLQDGTADSKDLDVIIAEVDRLDSLLKGLLVFDRARPANLGMQPVLPVVERARKLVQAQAEERGIVLAVESRSGNDTALFDPAQLNQVLLNVLLNSIEAVPAGGRVTISIGSSPGSVEIRICDTGPGLSADQEEHLFEAFFTTKPEGSGLGLAVSRELVENMGGQLVYEGSHPSATFVIRLPASCHAQGDSTDRRG